jgi:hypothetical protein
MLGMQASDRPLARIADHLFVLHAPTIQYPRISPTGYAAVGTSQGSELLWP